MEGQLDLLAYTLHVYPAGTTYSGETYEIRINGVVVAEVKQLYEPFKDKTQIAYATFKLPIGRYQIKLTRIGLFGSEFSDFDVTVRGTEHGQVGLIFDFAKLRSHMVDAAAVGRSALLVDGRVCIQPFELHLGVVEYIDWKGQQSASSGSVNPISYTYKKCKTYSQEAELRIALSCLGIGDFSLSDRSLLEFPTSLSLEFDFRKAFMDGTIQEILVGPASDVSYLKCEMARLGINASSV